MATLSAPTLSKLISSTRDLLNQPNAANSFWTDQELATYINDAIAVYFAEIVLHNEGQFNTQVDLNLVANTETVALPSDFYQVRSLYKKILNGYEILNYVNSVVDSYSTQGGTASNNYFPYYYFRDNNLVLRPTPNFSETSGLRLEYIHFPETLVNGGDIMSTQVSPVFKQLIEMFAVYKAKLKESLSNGIDLTSVPKANLDMIYRMFKDAISNRSKYPQFTVPFNPEGEGRF